MANTLEQTARIELASGGSLPRDLKEAAKDAQAIEQAAKASAAAFSGTTFRGNLPSGSVQSQASTPTTASGAPRVPAGAAGYISPNLQGQLSAISALQRQKEESVRAELQAQLKSISSLHQQKEAAIREAANEERRTLQDQVKTISSLHQQKEAAIREAANEERRTLQDQVKTISSLQKQKEAEEKDAAAKRLESQRGITGAGGKAFGAGLGAITGLGGLASTWALERFAKASADLGAVIGRDLLPYLDKATAVVRYAADAWLAVPGPIRDVAAGAIALATVAGGATLAIGLTSRSLAYLTATAASASIAAGTQATANAAVSVTARGAAASTGILSGALGIMRTAIVTTASWIVRHPLIAAAAALGAYALSKNVQSGSSYGAAPRGASITTTEGYLAELQTDVLKSGVSEAQKQTNILENIYAALSGEKIPLVERGKKSLGIPEGSSADKFINGLFSPAPGLEVLGKILDRVL